MTTTTFVNDVTVTDADWFNDVDRLQYDILGDPADAAAVRTALVVPTRTGGDASGTWPINVSGNAATATAADNGGVTSVNSMTGDVVIDGTDGGLTSLAEGNFSGLGSALILADIPQTYRALVLQIHAAKASGTSSDGVRVEPSVDNGSNFLTSSMVGRNPVAGASNNASMFPTFSMNSSDTATGVVIITAYQDGPWTRFESGADTGGNQAIGSVQDTGGVNALRVRMGDLFNGGDYHLWGLS